RWAALSSIVVTTQNQTRSSLGALYLATCPVESSARVCRCPRHADLVWTQQRTGRSPLPRLTPYSPLRLDFLSSISRASAIPYTTILDRMVQFTSLTPGR